MSELVELFDDEIATVGKIGQILTTKWSWNKRATAKNLEEFANEAKNRFLEAGLIVNVDITPALVGIGPPDIAIIGRVDTSEFDHDQKRKEITKKYEQEGRLSRGKLKKR